ncbi:MAG: SCO family protein [Vicinamibacterales bacterium]
MMIGSSRRSWWRSLTLAVVVLTSVHTRAANAADHFPFGELSTPRPIPAWTVTKADGTNVALPTLLKGHVTAIQLMFTSCNAICPLQGAAFARAQAELGRALPGAQFLSVSIDPASDTPAAMTEWLQTFGARAGWTGATPKLSDLAEIQRLLGDGGMPQPQGADPHSGQVYIVNRDGVLVYRTTAMPSARAIVDAMRTVSGRK